jgi:hypothetical protein
LLRNNIYFNDNNGLAFWCDFFQVFALFDRILLMAEGRVAYLGSTSGALDFFARSV